MNVLVISEDFRNDQYILKPIVEAMLNAIGKPKAKVRICQEPLLRGISQVLQWEHIEEITNRYTGMVQLFLLCIDRDGDENRKSRLDYIEQRASSVLGQTQCFMGENAWQEIEVWVLAGHEDWPEGWEWQTVRQEVNPKEIYFEPFARRRGVADQLAGGRKILAEEAARKYSRIRQLCPEDVENLENRIRTWMQTESVT